MPVRGDSSPAMLLYHRPVPAKIPKRRSRAEKKKKCNEERPTCDRCLERGLRCEYEPVKPRKRRRTVSNPEHIGMRPPTTNPGSHYGFHDRLQALRQDSSSASSVMSGSPTPPLPAIAEHWDVHSADSVFSDTASSCGSEHYADLHSPMPHYGPYDAMTHPHPPPMDDMPPMRMEAIDGYDKDPYADGLPSPSHHPHHHMHMQPHPHARGHKDIYPRPPPLALRNNSAYPDPTSAFLSPQSAANPYDFASPGMQHTPSMPAQSPGMPAFADFTSRESRRGLLDHFCNVLSHLIVFKEDSGNPFRQLILPMARKSPPLLNAIYAISSAHLEHRGLQVEERALDLHSKALQGLAGLIAHKDDSNRDEVLAVIVLLLYYEIVRSGSSTVLNSHLRGALSIMRERRTRRTPTSVFLERAFRYFDVASALSFGSSPMSGTILMPMGPDPHDRSAMASVDTLFGLVADLWPLMHRLVSLLDVKQNIDKQQKELADRQLQHEPSPTTAEHAQGDQPMEGAETPAPVESDAAPAPLAVSNAEEDKTSGLRNDFDSNLASIELALQQWTPKLPASAVTLENPVDDSRLQSIMNNAEAHKQACFVLLHRQLQGLPRTDRKVQTPVKQTLQACLRVVIFAGPMATLVWPLFTAACEAVEEVDRNVARTVFRHLETRQGMNNIVMAYEVCEEIWRRSDSDQPEMEWREVARSLEKEILFG